MAPSEQSLNALVAAMSRPDFYPERPERVEVKQTHISYVFLAGDAVYKIKKAVKFPFVDYSTLERRYHFCREEVRLNRRLAPNVYIGVYPIFYRGRFFLGEEGADLANPAIVDYAVKMRRLPDDRLLESMVRRDVAGAHEMRAIAQKLVEFHHQAPADRAPCYGTPEAVREKIETNFAECESFIGNTITEREFYRIQAYNRDFLDRNQELLWSRVLEGRVREGHGDLRCEHICMVGEILIIDCVEFSEGLRYGDVASELAFLAMDLDRLGASRMAEILVDAYVEVSGDRQLPKLMSLYKCYRAAVRGKVATLKNLEGDVPEIERQRTAERARAAFRLAYRYAREATPAIVIVCGLPGTGKSTIAKALASQTGFAVIGSDVTRKRLLGLAPTERARAPFREGIYDESTTERTYGAMLAEAERVLRERRGVIIDATFGAQAHRRQFLEAAARLRVPVLFVECRVDEGEVRRRLAGRERRADTVSDATWQLYQRQKQEFTPLSELPDRCHIVIERGQEPASAALRIEEFLDSVQ